MGLGELPKTALNRGMGNNSPGNGHLSFGM